MNVLVTNDDGIESVGIQRLTVALAGDGRFGVKVIAPDRDASGTSASLGSASTDGLVGRQVELPGAPAVEAWALNAPPAMCVLASRLGGFGDPPAIVVSGINAGLNTGRAVLHSGTVGAALTAQNFGMSALAVSLQEGDPWQWDCAARIALDVLTMLLDAPPRSVLNLNVPNRAADGIEGIRWARLAPFGEVRMAMKHEDDDSEPTGTTRRLKTELQLAEVSFDPDTDTGLVRAGFASITTLVGVTEAWADDRTLGGDPAAIVETLAPGAPLHETHRVPDADGDATLRRPRVGS